MDIRLLSRGGRSPAALLSTRSRPRRLRTGLLIVGAAMGMIAVSQVPWNSTGDLTIQDISYVYHGTALDQNHKAMEFDAAAVEGVQKSVLELIDKAPDTATWDLRDAERPAQPKASVVSSDVMDLLAVQAEIDSGLFRLDEEQQQSVRERLNAAMQSLASLSDGTLVAGRLDGILVLDDDLSSQPGDQYIDICKANDVPIPPNWPDERWVSRGHLAFTFADFPDAKTTEVFTYEEPNGKGVCYALVRKNRNKWYEAVGFICQSQKTGKACFWDNVIPGERMDNRIRGLEVKLDIRKIGNATNMRERCTDCHRGESVFLVHPGTPLDAVKQRVPEVRYTPLGQEDWENPPPMEELGKGACTQCHELAAPTKRLCGLFRQAAEKTMPSPARPAGWDNPLPEYKEAIEKIKARCAALDG
jgi:hypothetical protein